MIERMLVDSETRPFSEYAKLSALYNGRRALITGAAGSIGSELTRQLQRLKPSHLLLLDKDENGLYEAALDSRENRTGQHVEVVANIRDKNRLRWVFKTFRPEIILHAAAYKQVPMMERNPSEAVQNNIFGTLNLVELGVEYQAELFLFVSTDKAVNPTSVMGASKRVAEMVVRRTTRDSKTRSCCVRFGNVLGSRASVVPIFQKRISEGKNIEVTHPEVRRYFMTVPEAVQLVLQTGSLAKRGETFVLDMGDPVKIVDLAKNVIKQSGLVLGEDIQIEFTGLRPGEKLCEEFLIDTAAGAHSKRYPKIFVEPAPQNETESLDRVLIELSEAAREEDHEVIYRLFESLSIGFQRTVVPHARRVQA